LQYVEREDTQMLKKAGTIGTLVASGMLSWTASVPSAEALSGSYTILTSPAFISATQTGFLLDGCASSYANTKGVNGFDGLVLPTSSDQGHPIHIGWSSPVDLTSLDGGMSGYWVNGACQITTSERVAHSWDGRVPVGALWFILVPSNAHDITVQASTS
jgi:hypothetical protein